MVSKEAKARRTFQQHKHQHELGKKKKKHPEKQKEGNSINKDHKHLGVNSKMLCKISWQLLNKEDLNGERISRFSQVIRLSSGQ